MTGLARSVKSDIDACYEALEDAKYPQITSLSQPVRFTRKYKLNKSKERDFEAISEHVSYARSKFEIVEFSPEDATKNRVGFPLASCFRRLWVGCDYIQYPDTVGFTTPEEYGAIFKHLIGNVKTDRPDYLFASLSR